MPWRDVFFLIQYNKVCPFITKLLLYMYLNQTLAVRWNNTISKPFHVCNGVKQGGVISPTLFCVYLDDLLLELKNSKIGCHIGINYCGALAYADDIILMCPSAVGLQNMLDICSSYAVQHNIKFNAKKSQIIVFPSAHNNVNGLRFSVNEEVIEYVNKAKHLGHTLCNSVKGYVDVSAICNSFSRSVNMLMATFGKLSSSILYTLFKQYCTSYYGIVLCDVRSNDFTAFNILWRKALRRIYKVSPRTHTWLLTHIYQQTSLPTDVMIRMVKFFVKMGKQQFLEIF